MTFAYSTGGASDCDRGEAKKEEGGETHDFVWCEFGFLKEVLLMLVDGTDLREESDEDIGGS